MNFWNGFSRLYSAPGNLMRGVMANPMGVFIYGILSKWYMLIALASVVVVYWVFKGLEEAGVMDATHKIVTKSLSESKAVAKYCTPKIANPQAFWNCLSNVDQYIAEEDEEALYKDVERRMEENQEEEEILNPYFFPDHKKKNTDNNDSVPKHILRDPLEANPYNPDAPSSIESR